MPAGGPPSGKVLITSATAQVGGTERIMLMLSRTLSQRGIDVATVFPEDSGAQEVLTWFRQEGVDADASPVVRSLYQSHGLRDVLRFADFVRRSGAAVVNLHYGGNHISLKDVVAVRLSGKRCVVQVHDADEIEEPRKRRMTALAGRLADAVVVATPVSRDILARTGVPLGRISVVPCGLTPPALLPTRNEARSRLDLAASTFVVSSLARLTPNKGMAMLIEAVSRLPDQPSLRLLIAGEGRDKQRVESLGRELLGDRFRMLGRIPEPEYLYAASDVFALASRSEGFGLVFVEAAFQSVPSVAMDVGGVRHAVLNGETGLLVMRDDVEGFAAAIERLRRDPELRFKMGAAARSRALQELSASSMVDRYAQVLGVGSGRLEEQSDAAAAVRVERR